MAIKDKAQQRTLAGKHQRLEHGFTWFKILCLGLAILLIFAVRWGVIIVPQVRSTANQVANLNELKKVDMKIAGCIPIKGSL